jgi:hypothetical protein
VPAMHSWAAHSGECAGCSPECAVRQVNVPGIRMYVSAGLGLSRDNAVGTWKIPSNGSQRESMPYSDREHCGRAHGWRRGARRWRREGEAGEVIGRVHKQLTASVQKWKSAVEQRHHGYRDAGRMGLGSDAVILGYVAVRTIDGPPLQKFF